MKILIIGGHGFIGAHTTKLLCDRGHDCTVVDSHDHYGNYPEDQYQFVVGTRIQHLAGSKYTFIKSDMAAIDWPSLGKFDIVINAATCPDARYIDRYPLKFHDNFVYQNLRLLDYCTVTGARFVFVSSSMVYGDFAPPARESDIPLPVEPYGTYKYSVELLCQNYHRNKGLEYVVVRPSAVYGHRDVVVRVISQLTRSAVTTGKLIVNDPNSELDFTWVEDTAELLARLAICDRAVNQSFNIARGQGRKLHEAAEIVQSLVGGEIVAKEHDGFYPRRGQLDMSKTIETIGWEPKVSIEQGIPQYVEWFLANKSRFA